MAHRRATQLRVMHADIPPVEYERITIDKLSQIKQHDSD